MRRIISTPAKKWRRNRELRHGIGAGDDVASSGSAEENSGGAWRRWILAPDSETVARWNQVFLVTCIAALVIDPLYFFVPSVAGPACVTSDVRLSAAVTVLRSGSDLFFIAHLIMKFRTAYVAPNSKIFGRGEFVINPTLVARRYLRSDFVVDLFSALPLPQIVIWILIPATRDSRTDHTNNTLALIVLLQYIPRLFLMFPLNRRIIKTTGVVAKTAWAGAAYNLLLYMLASHVIGATWYLLSIGRLVSCWRWECEKENRARPGSCVPAFLDCTNLRRPERLAWINATAVTSRCDAATNIGFNFGMFADAFTNDVFSSKFSGKYLYCLWWGLRNLSSYGQNLETSKYLGETTFCILLCIVGLVLFAHLIGNMQTYLQSMTVRLEEWRVKRRDTEEWMRHRQMPEDLMERVRRFVQYQWLATRGVNEESILRSLPLDLRRDIQRHLCLSLVRRVPFFSQMDDQLLDAICERLVSTLSIEGTFIVREGDPVDEMLFVIRGQLESSTTNGGRAGFFNSTTLRPGDFCGEELLTWALAPSPSLNLPTSTRTVKALTEVEAFALRAEELRFVSGQFKRLHSKRLQHAFRYYSHQWRTWGACFVQAAWRRFAKRKMARDLTERYHFYSSVAASDATSDSPLPPPPPPGAASLKMPKLFKPAEPDFSWGHEDVRLR